VFLRGARNAIISNMISKDEVEKLALLSRLKLSHEEKDLFARNLEEIVEYISHIEHVSSKDLSNSKGTVGKIFNILRPDENPHQSGIHTEELVSVAPDREGDWIKVKKIL